MANTTLQIRHSTVAGNTPPSLANGEIAINSRDGVLYYSTPSGTVTTLSAASGPAAASVLLASVAPAASFLVPAAASGPAAAGAAASGPAASGPAASSASSVEQRKYTRSRRHKKVSKIIKSRKRKGTRR